MFLQLKGPAFYQHGARRQPLERMHAAIHTVWMNSSKPSLSAWWRDLDDHDARFDMPTAFQASLLQRAGEMLKDGLIDDLEHFDMCELVRSAAAHAIEEKMSDYLQPNGQYLLLDSAGQVAGRMDGYGVYFASDTGMQSRAIAKRGEHCYRVIGFSVGTTIGRISGDRMLLVGLPPLSLKLIGRRTGGKVESVEGQSQ